jgi:hypothetical protein
LGVELDPMTTMLNSVIDSDNFGDTNVVSFSLNLPDLGSKKVHCRWRMLYGISSPVINFTYNI